MIFKKSGNEYLGLRYYCFLWTFSHINGLKNNVLFDGWREKNLQKSDDVLLEETKKGNKKSFELLIIKYEKQIFNLIFNFTKERDIVPELAQETFLKAFRSIKSFKGNSSFYTWLRRIAINNSINYLHARNHFSLDSEADENNFFWSWRHIIYIIK